MLREKIHFDKIKEKAKGDEKDERFRLGNSL